MENNDILKEPTLEEYGLDTFSYENYGNQKNVLKKEIEKIKKDEEVSKKKLKESEGKSESILFGISYFLGFILMLYFSKEITVASIFSSIFVGIFLGIVIAIVIYIISSILNIDLKSDNTRELEANIPKYDIYINKVNEKIQLLKDKLYPFEQACTNFYTNYLKQFYDINIYKKHSGSEKFEKSLAEFSSMVNEVDEINKKLQICRVDTLLYKAYLEERQINHTYQINKKFNTYNDIKIKSENINKINETTQTKNQTTDLTKKVADEMYKKVSDFTISNNKIDTSDIKDNINSTQNKINKITEIKNEESHGFWKDYLSDVFNDIDKSNDDQSIKEIKNTIDVITPDKKYSTPRKIDWENINKSKSTTGMKGEEIVVEMEKSYLESIKREDLALKVKHISKEVGDGAGYDILSYFEDGQEKYIEVKSSKNSNSNSFNISSNELDFMKKNKDNYRIYRIFSVNENDQAPTLKVDKANDILDFKKITPVQYVVKME